MIDATAFGAELAGIVKAAVAPVMARLDLMEKRINDLPLPKDGKDADPEQVAALVRDQIKTDIDAVRDEVKALVPGMTEEQLAAELGEIESRFADRAEKAIAAAVTAIPPAKDGEPGQSVTVEDLAPVIAAEVQKAVAAIPAAKDGVGLAGALIDRDGQLVVTLTNGDTKALGAVVGGKGADGLGFDDLTVEYDGERSFSLVFAKGEEERAFSFDLPMMIDRGVFVDGKQYATGDTVTFGGSIWVAQKAQPEGKPGLSEDWRLAVKKGRNAKEV